MLFEAFDADWQKLRLPRLALFEAQLKYSKPPILDVRALRLAIELKDVLLNYEGNERCRKLLELI